MAGAQCWDLTVRLARLAAEMLEGMQAGCRMLRAAAARSTLFKAAAGPLPGLDALGFS